MATPFDEWLRQLAASGKGPFTLRTATRGRQFSFGLALPGDWTGATMRGEVRLAPDANGAALASFAVTGPVVASGYSNFTISLVAGSGANSTGILPADTDGNGVVELVYDLLVTPLGGTEELLFGGTLPLLGRVTL